VRQLTDWISTVRFPDRPWLVLGKGPTFSRRHEFDLGGYNLLSLNHVVNEVKVDVAHIIDVDVVEACAPALATNCDWLLMPRVPHVQSRPSLRPLEDFVEAIPPLRELDRAGRLVWYNAETGPAYPGSPVVEVKWFSSEAALGLLAIMGARQVRSLGIDGGQTYSSAFDHLSSSTRLANGLPSFDAQFIEIERIARTRAVDYQPLIEPVRVFVGTDDSQIVATRVLEHSLRAHTDALVRVSPMLDVHPPLPRKRENRPRTAFSFARFMIPQLAGYRGRAIYLDADMQVFGDILELWERPFDGHHVMCTSQDKPPGRWKDSAWFHPGPQMSVMVLDCASLRWDIEEIVADLDAGRYSYADLLFRLCIVAPEHLDPTLPTAWNHLEHFEPGVTRLLHYTVVPTQPWKSAENPLGHLWMDAYREAVTTGAVPPAEVERALARGHVRQELAEVLSSAPEPSRTDRSSTALELEATRRRIDELQNQRLRSRLWRLCTRFGPQLCVVQDRLPSRLIAALSWGERGVRRLLQSEGAGSSHSLSGHDCGRANRPP
jgi:hypothetical protein